MLAVVTARGLTPLAPATVHEAEQSAPEPAPGAGLPPPPSGSGRCEDGRVTIAGPAEPDLQPEDERTALVQRLDQYRAIASAALVDVP